MADEDEAIDLGFIDKTIAAFFRHSEAARNAGGIPLSAAAIGTEVPPGWVLEPRTLFFLPPNVILF